MSKFDLRNQFADIDLGKDRSKNDFRILVKGLDLKTDETKKVIDCFLSARQESEYVLKALKPNLTKIMRDVEVASYKGCKHTSK